MVSYACLSLTILLLGIAFAIRLRRLERDLESLRMEQHERAQAPLYQPHTLLDDEIQAPLPRARVVQR